MPKMTIAELEWEIQFWYKYCREDKVLEAINIFYADNS